MENLNQSEKTITLLQKSLASALLEQEQTENRCKSLLHAFDGIDQYKPLPKPLNPFIALPMDLERRYVLLDFERKGWFTTVTAEYSVIYSKPIRYMVRYKKTGLFKHQEEKLFLNQEEALRHYARLTR